ncbi:uncharacterized protein LOC131330099 [Rhododendron vialii]|uniref:uncharacterized protein LOC131330099 n=1 Tax=Rhododendron vialii TaxID=182163 RepID=UPI00265FA318|nr:uncharacterized protein LOC131330099 [Rhododendron vialii]
MAIYAEGGEDVRLAEGGGLDDGEELVVGEEGEEGAGVVGLSWGRWRGGRVVGRCSGHPWRITLKWRKVVEDSSWPICGSCQETIVHLFCTCPLAVQVWRLSPLQVDMRAVQLNSFNGFWDVMELWWHNHANKNWCMSMAAVMMWFIWKCRNGAIFEQKLSLPGMICKRTVEYLQEFLSANSLGPAPVISCGEGRLSLWLRPPAGTFKINVDGSWKKGLMRGGFGIVIRDFRVCFVAASMGFFQWCASSLVAEALAIRQGILLGSQLGLGSVILESDAQLLVNMLNGQAAVSQEVEVVIHDVQVLSNNFHCSSFSFVRRTINNVAHVLAGEGFCGLGYSRWTESPPLWLFGPLSRDESSV